jgi:hypothetical protein
VGGLRLMVVATLAFVLSGCGSSNPSPGVLSGKTAAETLRLALRNAAAAGTMRFRIETNGGALHQTVVGEAGTQGGEVTVTNTTGVVRIVVTGGVGYISAGAASLQSAMGLSATAATTYANRWISVTPADAPYSKLATSVSFSSTLAEFTPGGKHVHLVVRTIAGHSVGLIDGVGSALAPVESYRVELGVTTDSPVLPIAGTVTVKANGTTATQAGVFTLWGTPLGVKVPSHAVALSAIAQA